MFSTQHGLLIAYAVIVAEGSAPPNELQNAKMVKFFIFKNNTVFAKIPNKVLLIF